MTEPEDIPSRIIARLDVGVVERFGISRDGLERQCVRESDSM